MESTTREFFHIDDKKIYYETAGLGKALLFLHAGFVDSRMWDAQFTFFAQHYRVIRFDMSGFGRSDVVQSRVNRRQDLFHLMKYLGIETGAMIGCSLGGEIIIDFALDHPHMVTALVLVSTVPGGFEMQGEPPHELLEMMAALEQNEVERASELQLRLSIDGPFRKPEQVDSHVRQQAAEMNQIAVANRTMLKADLQPYQPLDPPAIARLNEILVPTLIIGGALDNPEILRAADVMAKEIQGARKVIISDSAHMTNMEKPEEFNQAVLTFLRETR